MGVLRWLFVLPAAIIGFILAQIVTILVTAFFPDYVSQVISSVTGPIGFVLLGARIAPRWELHVAGLLAILSVFFHGVFLGAVLLGAGADENPIVLWLSFPLAVGASILAIYIVYAQMRGRWQTSGMV